MDEQKRNMLVRLHELFTMGSDLPDELDMESPDVKDFLDTLPEDRRIAFLTAAKDPDIRKMSVGFNRAFASYWGRVSRAKDQGKKTVFIPFNCSPEIFYALDLVPIGVETLNTMGLNTEEGLHGYLDLAIERGLPDTMCSAQRGVVGMLESGVLEMPDLLVNGALGGCDPNSKIFEYISEKFDIPGIFLDVPYYHDQRSLDYYTTGYKKVVKTLEEFSGNKLDEDRLREVCELSNKATELFMEVQELKRHVPNPVPNYYNTIHLATKLTMVGTTEAVDIFQKALDVSKERLEKGAHVLPEEKVRFMMMYTGLYFGGNIHLWLEEEMGATYLLDMLVCNDHNPIIDTTSMETMLGGLAEGMLNLPMTRQLKGSWNMPANWLEDVLYYADTYKADCLVFTGHTACKQAWGVYRLVADEIKKQLGVPTLRLEGDGWDSRITPMAIIKEQISDFFETLE
jgi:benzoyl-CoA reductase/2-hydroxyglutaryl-CoA dehydratase subunit BcrC/BadD/HgdB